MNYCATNSARKNVVYMLHVSSFLDQQLIPYRYSSRCSYWGDCLHKSLRLCRFKSNRIVI